MVLTVTLSMLFPSLSAIPLLAVPVLFAPARMPPSLAVLRLPLSPPALSGFLFCNCSVYALMYSNHSGKVRHVFVLCEISSSIS